METILNQLFIGLSQASILLLIAMGLTFTFGQMGVINMAHGEFIMAGAYTPYVLQGWAMFAGSAGLAYAVSIPVAFVVAGALGLRLVDLTARVTRTLAARPTGPLALAA